MSTYRVIHALPTESVVICPSLLATDTREEKQIKITVMFPFISDDTDSGEDTEEEVRRLIILYI